MFLYLNYYPQLDNTFKQCIQRANGEYVPVENIVVGDLIETDFSINDNKTWEVISKTPIYTNFVTLKLNGKPAMYRSNAILTNPTNKLQLNIADVVDNMVIGGKTVTEKTEHSNELLYEIKLDKTIISLIGK